MKLTAENYFNIENQMKYWGVSQFKSFVKCEASGLAELKGEYEREKTAPLLVGSYVDAHFEGTLGAFKGQNPEIFKRDGNLKSEYIKAEEIINRVERDELFMKYMAGEKQVIQEGELFGVPWKTKIDSYHPGKCIVDLKVMKDMEDIYVKEYGWRSFIEAYGYDIQAAIYQQIEAQNSDTGELLPFYLAVVTKEKVPDIAVIQIPQHVLDTAYKVVEAQIDRFDMIKHGLVEPVRCEKCDYCKSTKVLKNVMVYESEREE